MTSGGLCGAATSRVAPAYGAGFVTAFGAHAVAANLAVYAVRHHSSLWQLGILLGVYDLAEVVLKPVFGSVVDRRGVNAVMVCGLVAFGLASAAFAVAGSGQWLGAVRLAQGSAAAAFSPAAGSAVAALGGTRRTGRLFGGYGGAKGLGYLLGPVTGGALVELGGYRLLFAVTGAAALGAAAWVALRLPGVAPAARSRSTLAALVAQIRDPGFWQPVVLLGAGAAALSAGVGFLPLLGARHHLGPAVTGGLVSLLAGAAAAIQPWAGRLHDGDRLPADGPPAALLVAAAGFVVAALVPGVATIAVAAVLVGAGVAVVTPVGFAGLAAGAPPERLGRTMGAGEVGRELGDAGGPALVGAFDAVGLGAGFAALAAALVACAGASSSRLRRHPAEAPVNPAGDGVLR